MSDVRLILQIAITKLRRKRGSLLAFAALMALFHWVVAASFPAIGGTAAVASVVQTFPPGFRQLLRIAPTLQAAFGLQEYLALSWFHPVFLGLGSAFVVGRAADALAGEIDRGSIYLILSRPVPRHALVTGKMIELAFGALVLVLAGWLGQLIGVAGLGAGFAAGRYLMAALQTWPLFVALGAIALVISSLTSRVALCAGIASAVALISFVLDVVPAAANSPLAALNPWHYIQPQTTIASGEANVTGALVALAWVVAGVAGASWIFSRRDLA